MTFLFLFRLTLAFLEGVSPQLLAKGMGEFWRDLVEKLNVNYPSSDKVEYPLRERFNSQVASIFSMRRELAI